MYKIKDANLKENGKTAYAFGCCTAVITGLHLHGLAQICMVIKTTAIGTWNDVKQKIEVR